jgi:hypothetical protein
LTKRRHCNSAGFDLVDDLDPTAHSSLHWLAAVTLPAIIRDEAGYGAYAGGNANRNGGTARNHPGHDGAAGDLMTDAATGLNSGKFPAWYTSRDTAANRSRLNWDVHYSFLSFCKVGKTPQ